MQTATQLWVGRSELVYVGPALGTRPHSTAVPRLLVAVDAPFAIDWGAGPVTHRCLYAPPRVRHQVATPGVRWAVCYLDPGSHRDLAARLLTDVPDSTSALTSAVRRGGAVELLELLGPPGRPRSRLDAVLDAILDDPTVRMPAEAAAARVGLSRSAFLREFGQVTGTTYQRYQQWGRLLRATRLARDSNVTTASADAGFASPSHLADTVRTVFGFTATELLATGVTIRTL